MPLFSLAHFSLAGLLEPTDQRQHTARAGEKSENVFTNLCDRDSHTSGAPIARSAGLRKPTQIELMNVKNDLSHAEREREIMSSLADEAVCSFWEGVNADHVEKWLWLSTTPFSLLFVLPALDEWLVACIFAFYLSRFARTERAKHSRKRHDKSQSWWVDFINCGFRSSGSSGRTRRREIIFGSNYSLRFPTQITYNCRSAANKYHVWGLSPSCFRSRPPVCRAQSSQRNCPLQLTLHARLLAFCKRKIEKKNERKTTRRQSFDKLRLFHQLSSSSTSAAKRMLTGNCKIKILLLNTLKAKT